MIKKTFLFKQSCIVRALTLILMVFKLLAISLKTTVRFILTARHSFRAVLDDNLPFLPHPGKFPVVPNCLIFL